MICWQGWIALLMGALVASSGCEKEKIPPVVSQTQPAEPEAPPEQAAPRPTAQELMSGPYKKLVLAPLPLAAQVPQSWEARTLPESSTSFLLGPGPGETDIRIALRIGSPIVPNRLEIMLGGMQKEAASQPALRTIIVRSVGEMKVLEERSPGKLSNEVNWRITYFVRRDLDYAPYFLDVLGLTESQLADAEPLLRKVIDSIVYEAPKKSP
jgi:hypothetical protein